MIKVRKDIIAPIPGNVSTKPWEGICSKKPWEYQITAVIPVLDTIDTLPLVIDLLKLQSIKPYIVIIDTGSCQKNINFISNLSDFDTEIHYIRMNGTKHPSDFPAVAMDLAFSMCRTDYLFATHSDCFLRNRCFLENLIKLCNKESSVVGYELSPRHHEDWKGMIGHTATMFYMPIMDKIGAGWSLRRLCHKFNIKWGFDSGGFGWPDTELCLNYLLKENNIKPLLVGHDLNGVRQIDENIDHCRNLTSSMLYSPEYYKQACEWKKDAMNEAMQRIEEWKNIKI